MSLPKIQAPQVLEVPATAFPDLYLTQINMWMADTQARRHYLRLQFQPYNQDLGILNLDANTKTVIEAPDLFSECVRVPRLATLTAELVSVAGLLVMEKALRSAYEALASAKPADDSDVLAAKEQLNVVEQQLGMTVTS